MENTNEQEQTEVKPLEPVASEYGPNELEPIEDDPTNGAAPESSPEQSKPEAAVEPSEAGTDVEPVVETPQEPALSPLDQYIAELEKEVGTKRGPNESAEAYALRLDNTRLKRERRQERTELFGAAPKVEEKPPVTEAPVDDPLSSYDPEEVKNFEKLAKNLGFVKKDELQANTWEDKARDILESFQVKHPMDDTQWDQFKTEFQSGKYNVRPSNPKLLESIFSEIHAKVVPQRTINRPAVAAGKEKIQSVAHGGTTQPAVGRKPIDPDLKAVIKDATDEELEEMSQ